MSWNRHGATREVVVIGGFVFKFPKLSAGWGNFLWGLLANMQERAFGTIGLDGLCPVRFSLPGGWLVVMPRAAVMTEEEFAAFDAAGFCDRRDYRIPAELKSDSFGRLRGEIVAIDYGSQP